MSVYPRLVLKVYIQCILSYSSFHYHCHRTPSESLSHSLPLLACYTSSNSNKKNSRMKLFNTLLSEVMFKQNEDMMDIEDILSRMNDSSSVHISNKSFTLLEIKPYLQSLHDSGHIFLVEDEGRHGVVYAI